MLSILLGIGLGVALVFVLCELAALVGHLGRIADALAAQNAHYDIDPVAHAPTSDTGEDAL